MHSEPLGKLLQKSSTGPEGLTESEAPNIRIDNLNKSIVVLGDNNQIHLEAWEASSHSTIRGKHTSNRKPDWPSYEFDRESQRIPIRVALRLPYPIVVPLIGASGQGHDSLVEFCKYHAVESGKKLSPRPIIINPWPSAAHPDVMLETICEQFASDLFGKTAYDKVWNPELLVTRLRADTGPRAPESRIIAVHEIRGPDRDDARVLASYLERLWKPVLVEGLLGPQPIMIFSVHTRRHKGWISLLQSILRFGQRAVVQQVLLHLESFASANGASMVDTPELKPITNGELLVYYSRVSKEPTNQVRETVRELMATTGGDFDAVIARIFRSEGI